MAARDDLATRVEQLENRVAVLEAACFALAGLGGMAVLAAAQRRRGVTHVKWLAAQRVSLVAPGGGRLGLSRPVILADLAADEAGKPHLALHNKGSVWVTDARRRALRGFAAEGVVQPLLDEQPPAEPAAAAQPAGSSAAPAAAGAAASTGSGLDEAAECGVELPPRRGDKLR